MFLNRLLCLTSLILIPLANPVAAEHLQYQGEAGPGQGKKIVLISGDHEYRSEETLPALGRILAKHLGFHCTVLFNVDPDTGEIVPGNNNLPGTDALQDADLMVIFTRFQNLPEEQMQPIMDYLDRGGPVIGLRTATHAFNIPAESEFAGYSYNYKGEDYFKGFGRQVLGETWVSHYGDNHKMSTRLDLVPEAKQHPVLCGVKQPWVQAGGYWTDPMPDSTILALAQPLQGMKPDSPPAKDKAPCPGAWVREYPSKSGNKGRVFTTTYGASEDILNDDFRRMLINACLWTMGLENDIRADQDITFVGPYHPVTFSFGGYRRGVKPLDLAGWDSPIMNPDKPTK